jgi:hypothetical protein
MLANRWSLCCALIFVVALFAQSRAQDVNIEMREQADQAVARFQTMLSGSKTLLDALRARELEERAALQSIARQLNLPETQQCKDDERTPNERPSVSDFRQTWKLFMPRYRPRRTVRLSSRGKSKKNLAERQSSLYTARSSGQTRVLGCWKFYGRHLGTI